MQADGKILAGGAFTTLAPNGGAPVTRNNIARLEIDGRLDQTLNLNIVGSIVHANAVQPDGKILIGGSFTTVLGVPRNNIARLNTDGTLDTAFNPNANAEVKNVAVQADGKILVVGQFTSIGGQTRNLIARLDATTGLADSFDPNASGISVVSIAVQADGKILAGGEFHQHRRPDAQSHRPARCHDRLGRFVQPEREQYCPFSSGADGRQDFSGRLISRASADRRATTSPGSMRRRLARLVATRTRPVIPVMSLHSRLQADGKILVGGFFQGIGGQPRNSIARLDPTTGLADSFNPNPPTQSSVDSIAVQADGKILVGGFFQDIGGLPRNSIARLDPTTGLA